jgi:hypothetical protein
MGRNVSRYPHAEVAVERDEEKARMTTGWREAARY